jgi:hypothetical protein
MPWNRTTLSHTTTIGIHRIVCLPGVKREVFLQGRVFHHVGLSAAQAQLGHVATSV